MLFRSSNGTLPRGVSLSSTGLLSGYIYPEERSAAVNFGFSGEPFDAYPFGAVSNSINKNYQFTVLAKNNRGYDAKTYTIYVYSKTSFVASNDELTVDLDSPIITADVDNKRVPVILDFLETDLGSYVSDNYYHHKFNGYDRSEEHTSELQSH